MFKTVRIAALTAAVLAATAMPSMAAMVLHRGNSADPETLDPQKTQTVYEANILRDMYEGLVAYDAKGQIIPGIAEKWTMSDDGTVYTFTLRDAKWSNGAPVTAHDFVYSFRRMLDPKTGAQYSNVLYPILNAEAINKGKMPLDKLGIKAIDDHTLQITLGAPTPYFIGLLGHQSTLPVYKPAIEKFGSDFVKPANSVTDGPFKLAEFVPNSHIKLVKNPDYYDAKNVKLDEVDYYPTEDRSAALRRFEAGELDMNTDVPTEQVDYIKKNLGSQFHVSPYLGTYYYAFNMRNKALADVRVRRALSMAVDRDFLADDIWGDTMLPAYSLVPPGIDNYGTPAYASYKDMSQLDREDAARKLLKEAGYDKSHPLKLRINYNTSENHKNTAVAIADMWKPLGVQVTLINTDTKTHYAMLRQGGDFDIARAGWIGDYSDPQNFLMLLQGDSPFNYAHWKNADYDKYMAEAAKTVDLKKRAELLYKAESVFIKNVPYLPLLYYGTTNLVSSRVSGFDDNLLDIHPSRWMSVAPAKK